MIWESLDPEKNIKAIFKAGESQGKSGSFFFFSGDRKFIIKTMTDNDLSTFKRIFPNYVKHVSTRPNSFLARIYGIYTITMTDMEPIHLILMANTKQNYSDDTTLMYVFDLKGSTVNRETKLKKNRKFKPSLCLKDSNLVSLLKKKRKDDGEESKLNDQ